MFIWIPYGLSLPPSGSQYKHILPTLRNLAENQISHSRWIHEFYVLQKDISEKKGYTDEEQKLCALLKEGPLITLDLAARMKIDPYHLPSQRLEQDGIVMKSGLTPPI